MTINPKGFDSTTAPDRRPRTINLKATRAKMDLINKTKWARNHDFIPSTVGMILNGFWEHRSKTGLYAQVMEALRADGYLVEYPDDASIEEAKGADCESPVHNGSDLSCHAANS